MRKASTGMDTVKACLRHLHAGHSVCLFAEGEQCWDGRTGPIFPATGKLVKSSGASLVTFRLEGGYLSLPRWGKNICRGAVRGHPVACYSPEQLGTLRTGGARISCSCGFERTYTEYGFFDPKEPFETLADWSLWQKELLHSGEFAHDGELLFEDGGLELKRVHPDHSEEVLAVGALRQYDDRLECGDQRFFMTEISSMAMVQTHLLLFTCKDAYYELRSSAGVNLRKYLDIWKEI